MSPTQPTAHDFSDVVQYTELLRRKEREIEVLSHQRHLAARRHHDAGATYPQLAEAMNVSEVAVYKMLKGRNKSIAERDKRSAK
ncbi:HTH DNA binding domain protein [Arthrobacter phage Salgado]|uniref:HTH DNA binding domain protein n=1 Tax=Arthrobacter phage Salgado TaxID=1772314 RepID=A0A0U4JPH1_9CAUD|nr:HTH DNA binding protein [Arthrobacter phage Salgado]ALY10257.1 HTH DNA binding domain protein [Arthrobacter phage Salgado]